MFCFNVYFLPSVELGEGVYCTMLDICFLKYEAGG